MEKEEKLDKNTLRGLAYEYLDTLDKFSQPEKEWIEKRIENMSSQDEAECKKAHIELDRHLSKKIPNFEVRKRVGEKRSAGMKGELMKRAK